MGVLFLFLGFLGAICRKRCSVPLCTWQRCLEILTTQTAMAVENEPWPLCEVPSPLHHHFQRASPGIGEFAQRPSMQQAPIVKWDVAPRSLIGYTEELEAVLIVPARGRSSQLAAVSVRLVPEMSSCLTSLAPCALQKEPISLASKRHSRTYI